MLAASGAALLSLAASPAERWFVVGSGLLFLGLLGVAFFFAAVRPAAMYPSPFWPSPRIERFFSESRPQVQALGAVHSLVAVSLLAFVTSVTGLLRQDAEGSVPLFWVALGGGVVASGFFLLSAILVWALSRPAVAESPPLLRTVHDLAYLAGGPAHVLAVAVFLGANSFAVFTTDVLPDWVAWLGIVGAAVSGLAVVTMFWHPAAWILPITRLLLGAWILSTSVLVAT